MLAQSQQEKLKGHIGDQALDDLVDEEHRTNAKEESERLHTSKQGSSWFGKVISNAFTYDGKSEIDILMHEVRTFLNTKLDQDKLDEFMRDLRTQAHEEVSTIV